MQFFHGDVPLAMTLANKFFLPYNKNVRTQIKKIRPMTTDSTPTAQQQDTLHLEYLPHIEDQNIG